jgi:hypothetical protein
MQNSPDNIPVNGQHVDPALVREIAGLIVASLNLDVAEAEIDPRRRCTKAWDWTPSTSSRSRWSSPSAAASS